MKKRNKEDLYAAGIVTVLILGLLAIGAGLFYGAGELMVRSAFARGGLALLGMSAGLVMVVSAFGAWASAGYVALKWYR